MSVEMSAKILLFSLYFSQHFPAIYCNDEGQQSKTSLLKAVTLELSVKTNVHCFTYFSHKKNIVTELPVPLIFYDDKKMGQG